ncbi:MAG: DNA recombination protein RmuC [Oscillospiraceae bacterium]|nr:DNA recombination protein RmuC [Oscillospiraceae bacterium]
MEYLTLILAALALVCAVLCLVLLLRILHSQKESGRELDDLRGDMDDHIRQAAQFSGDTAKKLSDAYISAIDRGQGAQLAQMSELSEQFRKRDDALRQALGAELARFDDRFAAFAKQMSDASLALREENRRALDEIRGTVDEKLQKTLEDRLTKSFSLVSERLEQVYKGLGEMQTLASGVGDLKKVLSNVKTRGILGEIQLGAILEELLSPEQYAQNIVTRKASGNPVEYAIRLPGTDGNTVYLPVDAKFPADAYERLRAAYDAGDAAEIAQQKKNLEAVIKTFARDIRDKYLDPPATTEFGIMFLPFEGLYAEVVSLGLVEVLQRDYKVSIAGPTTMAALLNSLQMGFRTLAIQKRSGEVWKVLGAVRTEFDRFGEVLEATQKRLEQTSAELDKLVGVRTRQIKNKLREVTSLPQAEAEALFGAEEEDGEN